MADLIPNFKYLVEIIDWLEENHIEYRLSEERDAVTFEPYRRISIEDSIHDVAFRIRWGHAIHEFS